MAGLADQRCALVGVGAALRRCVAGPRAAQRPGSSSRAASAHGTQSPPHLVFAAQRRGPTRLPLRPAAARRRDVLGGRYPWAEAPRLQYPTAARSATAARQCCRSSQWLWHVRQWLDDHMFDGTRRIVPRGCPPAAQRPCSSRRAASAHGTQSPPISFSPRSGEVSPRDGARRIPRRDVVAASATPFGNRSHDDVLAGSRCTASPARSATG